MRWIVLACFALSGLRGADLSERLPANATFVFGLKVRVLTQAPAMQSIAAQARAEVPEWGAMMNSVGFDPFADIDEVLIASMGEGKNAPSLVLIRGRVAALAKLKPTGARQ